MYVCIYICSLIIYYITAGLYGCGLPGSHDIASGSSWATGRWSGASGRICVENKDCG